MKKPILLLLLLTIFWGCNKEDDKSDQDDQLVFPAFSGYTHTDPIGYVLGEPDETDWTYDENWVQAEKDLFEDYASFYHVSSYDTSIKLHAAYPNPLTDIIFNLEYLKDPGVYLSVRLVNQEFEPLIKADSIKSNSVSFKMDEFSISSNTLIRVYYLFFRNDSCLYKGHGDIMVN